MSRLFLCLPIVLLSIVSCSKENDIDNGEENKPIVIVNEGKVVCDQQGVAGVVVTDGTTFVVTDQNGSFSIPYDPVATHVYITSPAGYTVPVVNSVPKFWVRLKDVPDKKNIIFNLSKLNGTDKKHYFIAVGDPQVRNVTELNKLKSILDFMAQDINTSGLNPVHLMVTGDVVFDTPNMHDQSKSYFSKVNQPVYYSIGNHDHVYNKSQAASPNNDRTADSVYVRHYGPTYYSFDRGEVHYIVLDNIYFEGGSDVKYSVRFTDDQLKWVKKDLSYVSKSKALVLMYHAPSKSPYSSSLTGNSGDLYALLSGYANVQIICGHTHYNAMETSYAGITEHIVGAACGGWWEGPVCPDGAPLGYKIFEADGASIKWTYRSYVHPEDQFSVFVPGYRDPILPPSDELLVNVWDWDSQWTVSWSADGGATFQQMAQVTSRTYDPTAFEYFGKDGDATLPPGRTWIDASPTYHIFKCVPPNVINKVVIKVVDRFGREYRKDVNL
ncbi:calcineurin-like phosphoesterase C-terminal domain-containing protein [Gaoshiqia sp. Z1-71]|uniref:calcineurin-like phosphoesterase C-terminal domain-containing protein n=1 Tax=Gaoshiqia hydrogeniformans TaxID=3290090 RepID=UPI003BF90986